MRAGHDGTGSVAEAGLNGRCMECGANDALIALGVRIDHPRRWLLWATTMTHIYLCGQCGSVIESTEGHEHRVGA